jgi:molybdopterin/thiamine biosynthesis adenylyltransferase
VGVRDAERYSRQILFPGIGEKGQTLLSSAHAVIAGCGALGSFQAAALVRAGVGNLTIIDRDYVEPNNLQRQWLFNESDAEQAIPKAAAAERHLRAINSTVGIRGIVADITASNIDELICKPSIILDGTDNFETRYLINDYAVLHHIPWTYGGAIGSYGVAMPVLPERSACFQCVYPDPPEGAQPTCETAGILNTVSATVAALQVTDALKILCRENFEPRITTLDLWNGSIRQINMPPRDPACKACGTRRFDHLSEQARVPISLCGRNAVQIHECSRPVDLGELKARLRPLGEVRANEFALRFFPVPYEMTIFPDGRAIIKGTSDVGVARSLYAKYIGI